MKLTIIGSGYVGLVSAVCFAKIGHEVSCMDIDKDKIAKLKSGQIPIYEPGLQEILIENAQNISFTSDLEESLELSQAVFIAVGTPQDEDGSADLSYVLEASEQIAKLSAQDKVIVTKSTVPVGTSKKIEQIIADSGNKNKLSVASNPEFLREGSAIQDFMDPDRIVIGVSDQKSEDILLQIYQSFAPEKIVKTDATTSELIKYASNSFLAAKISFINEMADLCEKIGGNIKHLSNAIGLDSRIGEKFLNPGPGFGGSCFPKDIMAILNVAKKSNVNLSVISSVINSNQVRKNRMSDKIANNFPGGCVKNKTIALLGLAFKAKTDDIRYSAALEIAKNLSKDGAIIKASDPEAIENSRIALKNYANISFYDDFYDAIKNCDAIVIATEWSDFKDLDFDKVKNITNSRKIIDLRNLFDEELITSKGFEYDFVGKRSS